MHRAVVCAALALLGVLAPLDTTRPPGHPQDIAGHAQVAAQSPPPGVRDGNLASCPTSPVVFTPNSLDESQCLYRDEPCPLTPLVAGYRLRYSTLYQDTDGLTLTQYPGFCELRVLEDSDQEAYNECTNMTGVVLELTDEQRTISGVTETVAVCRLLRPAACTIGVRTDSHVCEAIVRRGWTCPGLYKPKNEFNQCYLPPPPPGGAVPDPCGAGAPDFFVAQSCAAYVGSDYETQPTTVDCATQFLTEDPPNPTTALTANPKAGTSSDYWCQFDARFLKSACHRTSPPAAQCGQAMALCLKRATRTGGCSAIADTIHCRALQADFEAETVSAGEVRGKGCQPCVLLPFSPVPPDCPRELTGNVRAVGASSELRDLLLVKDDFDVGVSVCDPDPNGNLSAACLARSSCADPARGRLTWSSAHFSRAAIVNSPLVFDILDIPVDDRETRFRFQPGRREGDPGEVIAGNWHLPYPASPEGSFGDIMARFGAIDPSAPPLAGVSNVGPTFGECAFRWFPQFQLTIRELWPDSPVDESDILLLISPTALDWWNNLGPQQKMDRTLDRGLAWWPSLAPAAQEERLEGLTEIVDCNWDLPVWCRWTPTRSGYFKIEAAAGWVSTKWEGTGREVISPADASRINTYLSNPDNRQTLEDRLAEWRATPGDLGLQDDLDGLLPTSGLDAEAMYSGLEELFACGGSDMRIECGSSVDSGNYTETDPIGIAVHEVRVATRAPNS